MDKKEIFAFINETHIGFLATVDGKAGRVRGMDTYRADENGLIFYTNKMKNVFQQIAKNQDVEVCYYAKGAQVRVRGKMEILEDAALKQEIVSKRDFLKPMYAKGFEGMGVCRLKGKATVWKMAEMAAPMTWIDL
jgi:pyridoxamine 5'-phosphate oxidase